MCCTHGRHTHHTRPCLPAPGRLPGSFAGDPCQSLFGVAMSRLSGGLRWLAGHRAPNEVNVGVTIGHIQGDRWVACVWRWWSRGLHVGKLIRGVVGGVAAAGAIPSST